MSLNSSYQLVRLNSSVSHSYEKLTYPTFRAFLTDSALAEVRVAFAISYLSQPVGLILAELSADRSSAEICSMFVVPEHRKLGLGKVLLASIEKALCERGCLQANLVYITNDTTPALERLLWERYWSVPKLRMLVCRGSAETIRSAPWLSGYSLPPSFTIFPWKQLTLQERRAIQQLEGTSLWHSDVLCPFREEETIDASSSLGLRYQNQVVGWLITNRVAADTIRFTSLFVRKDLQRLGRAIPMIAQAINLRLASKEITKGILAVQADNTLMVNFVYRRLAPYLDSIRQSYGSSKLLKSETSAA